jgi:DNA replication protein
MKGFSGFADGPDTLTPIPEAFFRDLLIQIDQLAEMKLTLFIIWRLAQQEGKFRFLSMHLLEEDEMLRAMMPEGIWKDALERCVARGTLIAVTVESTPTENYFFLNSQRGRAAAKGLTTGKWNPAMEMPVVSSRVQRPNIFTLYEQNIGPLTPLIADLLRSAAEDYSDQEVVTAIQAAVENNARAWRYIAAVLEGRAAEDRGERKVNDDEERRKYIHGKYADFIEH